MLHTSILKLRMVYFTVCCMIMEIPNVSRIENNNTIITASRVAEVEKISGFKAYKTAENPVTYTNRNIRFQPRNEAKGLVIEDFESFSKRKK